MIQIIDENRRPEKIKPPSMTDRFKNAFATAVDVGAKTYLSEYEKKLSAEKKRMEDDQVRQLTGLDISGIEDPKVRLEIAKQGLQARQAPEINRAKYGAKLGALQEAGLGKYLQGEQTDQYQDQFQGKPQQEMYNEQGEIEVGNVKIPSMIPEQAIFKAESLGEHGLAQQFREHNRQILEQERHRENREQKARELEIRERGLSPENKAEIAMSQAQAKTDIAYNKELQSSARQHEIKTQTLNKLEKLNEKGVTGKPYEKLLEKVGMVNLTSEGRREFSADVKNLITDIRSILGGQFSNFEFQTILNAYPSADFSQEANRAIIKNLKEFQEIRNQEHKIANEIKKENGGKIPTDFQSKVNERLHEYTEQRLPAIKENTRKLMNEEYGIQAGHVLLIAPDGEMMSVPDDEVGLLLDQGASFP